MKVKCLVLDDEPLAVRLLSGFIQKIDFLELAASFSSAAETLKYLSEHEIDCIFLDIEMPDLNGIELTKILNNFTKKPEVVFVTAYGKYALEGLKLDAIDVLLKPFSLNELEEVAAKVKVRVEEKNRISSDSVIFVKMDAQQVKIALDEVLYVESMRDYVKIYTENRAVPFIPLMTLKKMKELLPSDHFLQINRSHIVNLSKITSFGKNHLYVSQKKFNITEKFREGFHLSKFIL